MCPGCSSGSGRGTLLVELMADGAKSSRAASTGRKTQCSQQDGASFHNGMSCAVVATTCRFRTSHTYKHTHHYNFVQITSRFLSRDIKTLDKKIDLAFLLTSKGICVAIIPPIRPIEEQRACIEFLVYVGNSSEVKM